MASRFLVHRAVACLALAGLPLIGAYHSVRGGHKLNHAVLCALMADPSAWTTVDAGRSAGQAAYPLVDLAARRRRGQADIAA